MDVSIIVICLCIKKPNFRKEGYEFSFTDKFLRVEDKAIHEHENAGVLDGRVLILNQGYEPVSICSAKKAMLLLILTKAELVAKLDGKVIRSPRQVFPHPSVIRIPKYYKVPFRRVELSRKNIIRRDNNKCQYCGAKAHSLTIDHVIPKSRGGTESWENLVAACLKCNNRKGNQTPEEARMPLLVIPGKPSHLMLLKLFMGTMDINWRPFLFMD